MSASAPMADLSAGAVPPPLGLLAELTHRCPLKCPYCSNPLELERRSAELDTPAWLRVIDEAAALGVLQIYFSGGEPMLRPDIAGLIAHAAKAGLYTNLITSGVGYKAEALARAADAGLDHVQLSIQGVEDSAADLVAGFKGAAAMKRALAAEIARLGLRLTVNAVVHRGNVGQIPALVRLAEDWGAARIEIAHVQYYGWAVANRSRLMPTRAQVDQAVSDVSAERRRTKGRLVIDNVTPDYYATYPKPCMGGWGAQIMNVTPSGRVLPCHAAETIPHLVFDNVREKSLADIWRSSDAFKAYRGTDWMQEPCRTCERREKDFGGCRCQAMLFAGDAAATDPACSLSPLHERMVATAVADSAAPETAFAYRGFR
jgi:PqqA peptide cyclase